MPLCPQSIAFVTYNSPFNIAKDVVHLQVLNTLRVDDASLVGEFKFVLMTAFHSARKFLSGRIGPLRGVPMWN